MRSREKKRREERRLEEMGAAAGRHTHFKKDGTLRMIGRVGDRLIECHFVHVAGERRIPSTT